MTRHKLVQMRRKAMMTQEDVAYRAGISRTRLARYETGAQAPGVAACRSLAKVYEVTFEDILDAIDSNGTELPSLNGGWWSNFEVYEQSAVRIRSWEPMVCPGLLQVEDYSRALLGGNDELVERRIARQAIIARPDDPAELVAIIDESILHRPVGGVDVLAAQLRHLVAISERQNITINILSLAAPEKAVAIGGKGAFVILEPAWPGGQVHLEHAGGARTLDQFNEMEAHNEAFDRLQDLALSPAESIDRLRHRIKELGQ